MEQKKVKVEVAEVVETKIDELGVVTTDLREIELREGIRMAERAGMKNQVELYRGKLKEYLDEKAPGTYVQREAELLGAEFFQTFPILEVISWRFDKPKLVTKAKLGAQNADPQWAQAIHNQEEREVVIEAGKEIHYGFKMELAPGVYIYYPFIVEDSRYSTVKLAGSTEEFVDYRGRMIPVAGLEAATKARESGWFTRIQVLDPLDITKHLQKIDDERAQQLENYKQMLERDPLVFGLGLDGLPRMIYHWIGQDEQAMTKEQIAEQIKGLEGMLSGSNP